ncbi:MAG: hypothetical protein IIB77_14760 [Proteobacteria bacterium]|nr:hypothetical protein [Pseudomonadota bacterium]
MTPLEETLEYINCARVAVKAGYKQMALDFLTDAEVLIERSMRPPVAERVIEEITTMIDEIHKRPAFRRQAG